jgi:hypothetical protein
MESIKITKTDMKIILDYAERYAQRIGNYERKKKIIDFIDAVDCDNIQEGYMACIDVIGVNNG